MQKTNEFSICLKPAREVNELVSELRGQLAPSPYRDDPPHITLVRGIVSHGAMSDDELLRCVAEITRINEKMPFTATVTDIINKGSKFYSESSALIVYPSDQLLSFRAGLRQSLISHNFTDESYDKNEYPLHMTIRLGVKLENDVLAQAKSQFFNLSVTFVDWSLFRLELENGARKMHEVRR